MCQSRYAVVTIVEVFYFQFTGNGSLRAAGRDETAKEQY